MKRKRTKTESVESMHKKMKTLNSSKEIVWAKHYASSHSILLVGEGDFSFSLVLARIFGSGRNITASSLDSREDLFKKYRNAQDNVLELERLGAIVLHEVDATQLRINVNLNFRQFDRIIYNFPHVGFSGSETSPSMISFHKQLVLRFFKNASRMLCHSGQVHVTHRNDPPYNSWNLKDLASRCSLEQHDFLPFSKEDYPGYSNKKGFGPRCDNEFTLKLPYTFMFKARDIHKKKKRATTFKFVACKGDIHKKKKRATTFKFVACKGRMKLATTIKLRDKIFGF